MAKSNYVCDMEKKKQILVNVDVVNDAIQKLKNLKESFEHELEYKCYDFTLEDYLDCAKDLYETLHIIKDLEVSLEHFKILEECKQSNATE